MTLCPDLASFGQPSRQARKLWRAGAREQPRAVREAGAQGFVSQVDRQPLDARMRVTLRAVLSARPQVRRGVPHQAAAGSRRPRAAAGGMCLDTD
jgi:hypothetical protein